MGVWNIGNRMLRNNVRLIFGLLLVFIVGMVVLWQNNKTIFVEMKTMPSQPDELKLVQSTLDKVKLPHSESGNLILTSLELERASSKEVFEQMWDYVYKIQYQCSTSETLGGRSHGDGDGSYPVCMETKFWKGNTGDGNRCLVYSFGVGNDFSFDDEMAKKGCEVHSFDPTTELQDGFERESGVVFHKIGISSKDNDKDSHGWKMRTLRTLLKELSHNGRYLDFLKVDTDSPDGAGFEDETIQELLDTGLYKCVREFGLEIHLPGPFTNPTWLKRLKLLYRQLSQLYERKYRLYAITDNVRADRIVKKNPNFSQKEKKGKILNEAETILWEVAFVNLDPRPCQL